MKYKWRIDQYGSPYSGGWMEWPAGLLNRMNKLYNAYKLMDAYRQADNPKMKHIQERYGKKTVRSIVKLLKVKKDGNH